MSKTQIFTQVPVRKVPRNMFDLSHEVKMSGKFGKLYPVLVQECMPGDSMHDQMTAMVRTAPLLSPLMHRVNVKTDAFFCPMRLVNSDWEEYITGGQNGDAIVILPFVTPASIIDAAPDEATGMTFLTKGSLWDYMGLPSHEGAAPTVWSPQQINVLPFRAYQKIYNDWFRDPNLDPEVDLTISSGANQSTNFISVADGGKGIGVLRTRGWERDAFTGALPFAQRGAAVLMPLAGTGNVSWAEPTNMETLTGAGPATGAMQVGLTTAWTDSAGTGIHPVDGAATVDIDGTTTINDLRTALAIQRWLENNARGGARYNEQILAHYGQKVPDYRLQRSEYLGGGRQVVQISQVLATAESVGVPVGDMAGHGISVGKTNKFRYKCEEHGYIIMILSVVPTTAYMQGIDKMWFRENRYDFAFPEFANLGEQEVKSKEVFFSYDDADTAANNGIFGYNPRYWEYKFKQDRVSGDFRDELMFWHLTRKFLSRPALDSAFVQMDEDGSAVEESYRRIFAVQDGTDYFWMQLFHRFTAMRPLPYFGVPELKG